MVEQLNKEVVFRGIVILGCLFVGLMVRLVSAEFASGQSNTFYLPAVSYEFTDLTWTEVGVPYVIETTFEIDPNRPNTIYVGSTDYQGAWRSQDGGQSWEIMGNGLPITVNVHHIATAPISPTFIFAGVRGLTQNSFRSWDGGDSWQSGTMPHSFPIASIAVNPVTPTTIFWGNGIWDSTSVGGEVFRSMDGGNSWSEILPSFTNAIEIVIDHQNPNVVFIGCSFGGMLKSLNGGDNWQPMNNGLPSDDLTVENILLHPDDSQIVYITAGGELYRSSDGGGNWISIGSGLPVPRISSLAMNPDLPEMMFATPLESREYYGVYQSLDGGYSWQRLAPGPVDHYALEMKVQVGLETSLFVLFDGYSNDDDRLWKLNLVQ